MSLHVFGIRHHGLGCAKALAAALDELQPDVLLLEGPADAEPLLTWAADEALRPPVAMLVYPTDEPHRGVFYPLAVFSPEWQALRYAARTNIPVRMMDLPLYHGFAIDKQEEEAALAAEQAADENAAPSGEQPAANGDDNELQDLQQQLRVDPLGVLAEAAGYSDRELWWEEQIEQRHNATGLFAAILEAMQTVRAGMPAEEGEPTGEALREARREATMRKTIRAAQSEGFERIAVICGAWHAPVLAELGPAKADNDLLRGLPKVKTTATWIPWTHSRLSYASGYGAGVRSPGWYAHLWHAPSQAGIRWVATASRLLREADLDAPSASAIEAVRLADALAALRERCRPGLAEYNDALLSVVCHGNPLPMQLVRSRLEIGEALGAVPEAIPAVPLQRDLEAQQKSLRLKPSTEIKSLDLDLREPGGLARSQLLHRLTLLDVAWGRLQRSGGKTSTFHEIWQLQWQPEFAVSIIDASVWGTTVEAAAVGKVIDLARQAKELAPLTGLLDQALLADLPGATDEVLARLQRLAAVTTDTRHLLDALLPLARIARYGNVRGAQSEAVVPIIEGLFERAVIGLPSACGSLDDEAARLMSGSLAEADAAVRLLEREDLLVEWHVLLERLASGIFAGLLRGRCCRLLLDAGVLGADELTRHTQLALSRAVPAAEAAGWVEGLLSGSGLALIHHDALWSVLDGWLCGLVEESFIEVLPLLRRSFATFQPPERRAMSDKIKALSSGGKARVGSQAISDDLIDAERAARVLPLLAQLLGVPYDRN